MLTACHKNKDQNKNTSQLTPISIDVVYFEFIPDTGNNTSRLRYEIEFNNSNEKRIKGSYTITINTDGIISSIITTDNSPCIEIEANANCRLKVDQETSLDIGLVPDIKLVSVTYTINQ